MKTLTAILVISGCSFAAIAQEKPFPMDTQGKPNRINPPDTQKIIQVPMDTGKMRNQTYPQNQNPHIGIPPGGEKKNPNPGNNPPNNRTIGTTPGSTKANTGTTTNKSAQNTSNNDHYVVMKNGKVCLYKNGKKIEIQNETTLGGTKVKANGAVILKNGATAMLQEGDKIDANGKIVKASSSTQKQKSPGKQE